MGGSKDPRTRAQLDHAVTRTLTVLVGVSLVALLVGSTAAGSSPHDTSKGTHPAFSMAGSAPLSRHVAIDPPARGFSTGTPKRLPKPVSEIVSDRTASSSTWKNTDGSITVRNYAAPHYYRSSSSAQWQPIDTKLSSVSGKPGWWESGANN